MPILRVSQTIDCFKENISVLVDFKIATDNQISIGIGLMVLFLVRLDICMNKFCTTRAEIK